jgi:ribosomal subunit interface protein
MTIPLQVTFRHTRRLRAIEQLIERKVEKFGQMSDRITGVHVLVEVPHRHQHKGRLYHVRVTVNLPGREIVASKQSSQQHDFAKLHAAINDVLNTARRELKRYVEQTKRHTLRAAEQQLAAGWA